MNRLPPRISSFEIPAIGHKPRPPDVIPAQAGPGLAPGQESGLISPPICYLRLLVDRLPCGRSGFLLSQE
ncbi:MAG: hypothetical protein OXR07_03415 [Nitrospira sp.]|nr:hypothetical protein [Nitrospira sp.]